MLTSGSCTSGMTPTASYTANNQLTSALYHYDQAGDVDVDPQNQYLYDAEGRICAVSSPNPLGGTIMTGYIYDADGTRVSKGTIQAWSCNPTTSGYTTTSDYILGPGGEQFSEYTMTNGTMTWLHTNVWADGMLIATYAQDDTVKSGTTTQNGLLHFYFDDPLGTRRAQTDYAGHLEQNCSSLPYGDSETCGSSPTEHLFTGKERDAESGNDYFGARYYASSMGRFMSPDWSAKEDPVPYAKLDDPQSLNLYAYVRNNPLGGVDSNGHEGTAAEATAQAAEDWIFGSTPVQFDGGKKRRPAAQQQNPNQVVGNTTEGSLAKVLTNEDGSLSTPKGGAPQELVDGKTDLANAIYNNANLAHPEKVAPDTGTASAQDSQIMQGVVTSRTNGGADPAQGRHYYGTSHHAKLKGRSALNGLKGAAGRESVFARFGPFHDSMTPHTPTYIYIYNDPGH